VTTTATLTMGVSRLPTLPGSVACRFHREHQDMRHWVGKHFNLELFSVQQVNAALALFISIYSKP